MFEEHRRSSGKRSSSGPNLIQAYYELGRAHWFAGQRDAPRRPGSGPKANKFNPWGKRCKEMLDLAASGGDVPRSLVS